MDERRCTLQVINDCSKVNQIYSIASELVDNNGAQESALYDSTNMIASVLEYQAEMGGVEKEIQDVEEYNDSIRKDMNLNMLDVTSQDPIILTSIEGKYVSPIDNKDIKMDTICTALECLSGIYDPDKYSLLRFALITGIRNNRINDVNIFDDNDKINIPLLVQILNDYIPREVRSWKMTNGLDEILVGEYLDKKLMDPFTKEAPYAIHKEENQGYYLEMGLTPSPLMHIVLMQLCKNGYSIRVPVEINNLATRVVMGELNEMPPPLKEEHYDFLLYRARLEIDPHYMIVDPERELGRNNNNIHEVLMRTVFMMLI